MKRKAMKAPMELAVEVVIKGGLGSDAHQDWIYELREVASLRAFARAIGNTVRDSIQEHMKKGDYIYTLTLNFGQTWGQALDPGDVK